MFIDKLLAPSPQLEIFSFHRAPAPYNFPEDERQQSSFVWKEVIDLLSQPEKSLLANLWNFENLAKEGL